MKKLVIISIISVMLVVALVTSGCSSKDAAGNPIEPTPSKPVAQENPWDNTDQMRAPNIEMVRIPSGSFWMGSQSDEAIHDEKPAHKVTLSSFQIGKYEVTQGEWQAVMGTNPSALPKGGNYPVENVSWDDVQKFITKLNQLTGKRYRMPTEAEWEYAARGGKGGPGNDRYGSLDQIAWYNDNSGGSTHPIGGKQPNAYGLYDMLGNVCEWCQDGDGEYTASAKNNPTGPSLSGSQQEWWRRSFRGGSKDQDASRVRAPARFFSPPGDRCEYIGLRLAMDG